MHKLFLDFPFCSIFQTLYSQTMDIILNEYSTENLIKYSLFEKTDKEEKSLIQILIDNVLNNLKFKFDSSNRIAFHPNFSYEVSILTKIFTSKNEHVKNIIKDNKNLEVFNTVIGDEVNKIFEQKLLLSENDVQFNSNDESEDKKPSSYFGQKNFMEMLDEDINIYNIYLKGGDYQKSLEEKKEKEKIEREKLEKEKMEEEEKKKKEEDGGYFGGEEEDEDNKKDDLKGSINLNQDNEEENKDNNEGNENNENNEDKNKEEDAKEKEKVEENKEETSSEETEEEKHFNDVNFWKPEISPNDDIMSSILTDLE